MKLILFKISIIVILLYIFLSFYNMTVYLSYYNINRSTIMAVSWVGYLTLLINIVSFSFIFSKLQKLRIDKITYILVLIAISQFFSNFVNSNSYKNIINYIFQFNTNLVIPIVYVLILNMPLKAYDMLLKSLKLTYFIVLGFYIFYWNITNNFIYTGEGFASFNNAYYLAYILPIFLINKSKYNNLLIIVTLIVVISSMKRGGTIAFILGILFYYFTMMKNISLIKKIFISLITLIIGSGIILVIDALFENALLGRFEKISEDQGSSRSTIFEEVFNNYLDFNIIELIIGKGENISVLLNSENLTSHNDYLEILVSFGIIGLILYFIFFLLQFFIVKKIFIRNEINKSSTLIFMIVLTLFLMLVSHVIIYPLFILYIINLAILNFKKKIKHNENRIISIS